MAPISRGYRDRPDWDEEGSTEENPCSKKMEETHENTESLYLVDNLLRKAGSGLPLEYVVRRYCYSNTDENTEGLHLNAITSSKLTDVDSTSTQSKGPSWQSTKSAQVVPVHNRKARLLNHSFLPLPL